MKWVLLLIVLLAVCLFFFLPEFQQTQVLQGEKQQLEQQVREQDQEYQRQHNRLEALRNDPRAVENAARDRLKLAKPDETIFRFQPEDARSTPAQPAAPATVPQKDPGNP
ncbi:MAG: septum formation initiator family protein [Verrucomicrobia bacterium]|nr:septum formation initiator family protein [Verrucomicrobiota bacterium]